MTKSDPRLRIAIDQPDMVALLVWYRKPGAAVVCDDTLRVISPCHTSRRHLLAFCATRGDFRTFELDRLEIVSLVWSWSVTSPVSVIHGGGDV